MANHKCPVSKISSSGFNTELLDARGTGAQIVRRADVDHVAVAEIQRAAIQRADFRQQFLDMNQALERADQVGIRAGLLWVVRAELKIATHAGGEVDDHVRAAGAYALHHLAVERRVAAELARLWVAHVDMRHGGAGGCSLDGGIGNLLWCHRYGGMPANRVAPRR